MRKNDGLPFYVTEADKNQAKVDTLRARSVDPTIPADAWKDHAIGIAQSRKEQA